MPKPHRPACEERKARGDERLTDAKRKATWEMSVTLPAMAVWPKCCKMAQAGTEKPAISMRFVELPGTARGTL
jgi:hypothetical protein